MGWGRSMLEGLRGLFPARKPRLIVFYKRYAAEDFFPIIGEGRKEIDEHNRNLPYTLVHVPLRKVEGGFSLGRASSHSKSDYELPNMDSTTQVSRKHLLFHRAGRDYVVEDAGSSRGTYVNGREIQKLTRLKDGDVIVPGKPIGTWTPVIIVYDGKGKLKLRDQAEVLAHSLMKRALPSGEK